MGQTSNSAEKLTAVEIGEIVGFAGSAILMAGIFIAAIVRIGSGVYGLVIMRESPSDLSNVLKGIEYLFLAPLVLLAYVSMIRFIRSHFPKSIEPATAESPSYMAHSVKLSLGFLVTAVLLTDLAEKALTNGAKDWLNLVGECVAVILGLAYVLIIQRVSRHD